MKKLNVSFTKEIKETWNCLDIPRKIFVIVMLSLAIAMLVTAHVNDIPFEL